MSFHQKNRKHSLWNDDKVGYLAKVRKNNLTMGKIHKQEVKLMSLNSKMCMTGCCIINYLLIIQLVIMHGQTMMHGYRYVDISEHHVEYCTICETCWGGGVCWKEGRLFLKVFKKSGAERGRIMLTVVHMYNMIYTCICLIFVKRCHVV